MSPVNVMSSNTASVPIKLLYEGVKQVVTVELKNGDRYKGELVSAGDNMNVQMEGVVHTAKDGQVKKLEQIYIRGSQVKLFVLPDILREAPLLKKVLVHKKKQERNKAKSSSGGRGRGRGRGRGGGGGRGRGGGEGRGRGRGG